MFLTKQKKDEVIYFGVCVSEGSQGEGQAQANSSLAGARLTLQKAD